jgi:hypothetical protein
VLLTKIALAQKYMTVAVAYLARGEGNGISAARRFFASYIERSAGSEHVFYLISKGWTDKNEETELKNLAKACDAVILDQPDHGYDWGAYFRAVKSISEDSVIFLNSHSTIVADNWLSKLLACFTGNLIGAVGATGSFSSWADWRTYPPFNFRSGLTYPIRVLWRIRSFLRYRERYDKFPNIHLRSNAFIIKTDLFKEFAIQSGIPRSKAESHELESGIIGLSNFIRSKNMKIYICDVSGNLLPPQQWPLREIFRVGSQRDLLIADNQTGTYEKASLTKKRRLEYKSWHK